ncbi:MAG: hypothetical protein IJG65_10200 [Synergistaceae bacterium]|nr:hypothetical protein [Synergistaceae bacterium]
MNELHFTVLGPSGCGKTTLLACMNEYFGRVMSGSFEAGDTEIFKRLSDAYTRLKDKADDNGHEIIFSGGIEGTDAEKQYPFTLKGSRRNIALRFFDFPGGWIDPRDPEKSIHFKRVSETAQSSKVIIAVINSPYLMQYDGKYRNYAGIDETEYIIENSLTPDGGDKLILLVPVKCEKYLTNGKYAELLRGAVKKYFTRTISLAGNQSPYYGKLAVAILPVKTMGNVQLRRFEVRDGEPVLTFGTTGSVFRPEDTDQPLRYALSFLLGQYMKRRSGFTAALDWVFGGGNLDKIIASIREGMRENFRGSEIIAGRELLGFPPREGV